MNVIFLSCIFNGFAYIDSCTSLNIASDEKVNHLDCVFIIGHIMKLLVRNLSRTTTEREIHSLFIAHGAVASCDLVLDKVTGKSKGFAFVEMPNADEANAAIAHLHERRVAKNRIRVKISKS